MGLAQPGGPGLETANQHDGRECEILMRSTGSSQGPPSGSRLELDVTGPIVKVPSVRSLTASHLHVQKYMDDSRKDAEQES